LGKFWRVLQWNMALYFNAICLILRWFGIFCGHLKYFKAIWYIFPCFGVLHQEKSGNPGFSVPWGQEQYPEICRNFCVTKMSELKSLLLLLKICLVFDYLIDIFLIYIQLPHQMCFWEPGANSTIMNYNDRIVKNGHHCDYLA
jgi:hypothetical protein